MRTVPLGIVIKDNKILLVKRRFHPKLWGPPGGFVEEGEELHKTVVREVFEETGIECSVIDKFHEFHAYDTHLVVYACKYTAGGLRCSYESIDIGWFNMDSLPEPLSPEPQIFKQAIDIVNKK